MKYFHHRLRCRNMWSQQVVLFETVYRTFKRWGHAGRSASLGAGSEGLPRLTSCSLSASCVRMKMWSASLLLLPPCCAFSHQEINPFFFKLALVMAFHHSTRKVTSTHAETKTKNISLTISIEQIRKKKYGTNFGQISLLEKLLEYSISV